MEICHLQFGQSIAKTYMATAILMLYGDGKLDLDEKITAYLPESVTSGIANTEDATVRMLLNHTSGIAEYNDKPNYVTYLLQHIGINLGVSITPQIAEPFDNEINRIYDILLE